MDFKTMTIDDIIAWCKANNQVEWLKAEIEKKQIVKRHTGKVQKVNKNGKVYMGIDKNSPVVEVEEPISFIALKYNFCQMFMSDIIPKAGKPKTPSMYDKIRNL